MQEKWKPIKGYEGLYEISNLGRVKSLSRKVKSPRGYRTIRERIIKPTKINTGYLAADLFGKRFLINRLVWSHFGNNDKTNPEIVHHIDENKENNSIDNLKPLSHREHNVFHNHKKKIIKSKLGTYFHKGKWCSRIFAKGKNFHLGRYDTEEEAHQEYLRASNELIKTGKITVKTPYSMKRKNRLVGAHWKKEANKWTSEIRKNNKRTFLGYFDTEIDAHLAYQKALSELACY